MSEEDKSQKTEEPTPKKLSDQRKKGDVPSSKEAGTMMSVFVLMVITSFLLPQIVPPLVGVLSLPFEHSGTFEIGTGQAGLTDIGQFITGTMARFLPLIAPVFLFMVVAAIFGVLIQGETVVATERIKPKFSNISLFGGVKKIVSVNNLVEFTKSITKLIVVIIISYFVVRKSMDSILQVKGFVPEAIPDFIRSKASLILLFVAALLVPVAIADIIHKRFEWIKKNRMSLKEVRDEFKDAEGDPHMKAKRAEKRQEMSRNRVKQAVPKATVILTNPTHYAVALRYEQGVDAAPVCVAKGVDNMARTIRELAYEHDVPVIENKPLARALYAEVEVDQTVPGKHWAAIAEIVAFILDLRRNVRRKPPEGSSLRDEG